LSATSETFRVPSFDEFQRIAALEEKAKEYDHDIEMLQLKFMPIFTDFGRLLGEVSTVQSTKLSNSPFL
jgi:hypothetical protein